MLYDSYIEYCTGCKKWHSYNIWNDDGDHYVVTDQDGNVEGGFDYTPQRGKDYPDEDGVLKEYYEYVWRTGDDHLNLIQEKVMTSRKQRWTVKVAESLLGVILRTARPQHGKTLTHNELPPVVVETMAASKHGVVHTIDDISNFAELDTLIQNSPKELNARFTHKGIAGTVKVTIETPYIAQRYVRKQIQDEAKRRLAQEVK